MAATQMLTTLRKFKEHLDLMEADFEQANQNNNQLSKMLHQYECQVVDQFGSGERREIYPKDAQAQPGHASTEQASESSFMVFD